MLSMEIGLQSLRVIG
jgi:hypothetical protein